MTITRLLFEDQDDGPEWAVTYSLSNEEFDDSFDSDNTVEVRLNAVDFDTAVKYAQQYLRKKQTEEDTADEWSEAEILSIQLN